MLQDTKGILAFGALLIIMTMGYSLPAQPSEISYGYDAAGRLTLVDYGNGVGIQYTYDAAGNLLRRTIGAVAPAPAISRISPSSGPVGTLVTIVGSNFIEGTVVYFGGIVANIVASSATEIAAVVPPGATTGTVSVLNSAGSAAGGVFTVTPALSQKELSIQSGGAASTFTVGPYGVLRAGYAKVTATSGEVPYGTAVFSYTQNGVVVSEVGVPSSPPTTSARIFVDFRSNVPAKGGTLGIFTGFAAVNLGAGPATITMTLRDPNGNPLRTGSVQLAKDAHFAKFLDQFAPDFQMPAGFAGIGSLDVQSNQPLSVLALRLTTNQRGDLLITSTPVADLTRAAPIGALVFPQVADGGGYQTTLIFLNTSSSIAYGKIRFQDDRGGPLLVRSIEGGSPASEFPYSIPPSGLLRFVSDGSPANVSTGWAQVIPDSGSPTPVGAGVFSFTQGQNMVTESGVPAAIPTTRALIYVDKSSGHDTGLAIANPGAGSLRITMTALHADGRTPGANPGTFDLISGGHAAKFVGELIPGGLPEGFTGVLDIRSDNPFAALTLRSLINVRGDFLLTTFPSADATRSAPSPVVFPQIVDGGGYQTQFIMLSTSAGASSVTLRLQGDDGTPIDIGRGAVSPTQP